jgi:hypothetical protein
MHAHAQIRTYAHTSTYTHTHKDPNTHTHTTINTHTHTNTNINTLELSLSYTFWDRGDVETVRAHIAALRHDADLLEAYAVLGHYAVRAKGDGEDEKVRRIDAIFQEHMTPRPARPIATPVADNCSGSES